MVHPAAGITGDGMGAKLSSNRETEAKLAVPDRFAMPDLDGVAGLRARPLPVRELDARYYDTPDLRLARRGITLRHRDGDVVPWTLKLPEDDGAGPLRRRELSAPGEPGDVPAGLAALVTAQVRRAALDQVARLRTTRAGVELVDAEGVPVAEVVEDDVAVEGGPRGSSRIREVEVEVLDGAPDGLLETLVKKLRRAGCRAGERRPKLVQALGPAAEAPPEGAVEALGKAPAAADVVRAAIAGSVARILRHDAGVRLGDDPEDVHQARVGARRLRSDLRTFRALLDPEWLDELTGELRWLGEVLGAVRDADVLGERLARQGAELPPQDAIGVRTLLQRLERDREIGRIRLLEAMASDRYLELLDRLVEAARAPRTLPEADLPAAKVLPALARKPWRRLRREVRALPADPPDEALHRVRIRAKRARYAAEACRPVAGDRAHALAGRIAEVQGVLGDHQDAAVAEAWLRAHSRGSALVAGQLVAAQRAERAALRAAWPDAWRAADRKRLRKWLG
jgi:CHAD domain-containing protein